MPQSTEGLTSDQNSQIEPLYNVGIQVRALLALLNTEGAPDISVPGEVKQSLETVVNFFQTQFANNSNSISEEIQPNSTPSQQSIPDPTPVEVRYRVKVTQKTTIDRLYIYHHPDTIIEYPETHANETIGHLFAVNSGSKFNPLHSFVYSLGYPMGINEGFVSKPPKSAGQISNTERLPHTLLDRYGITVPHRVHFSKCQGMKACPFVNQISARTPHTTASREKLSERLQTLDSEERRKIASPSSQVFLRTLSYFSALKQRGCSSPLYETTVFTEHELPNRLENERQRDSARRGHPGKETCKGRLLFGYSAKQQPFIRCEHYNSRGNKDHFIDFTIASGLLDAEYLEALFFDDNEAICDLELDASLQGIGPLAPCTTIRNQSSVQVNCDFDHRDQNGKLVNPKMIHLKCESKFRMYEPLDEFKETCPWVLVICQGAHTHPIPVPSKTPPSIVTELLTLIRKTDHALPDLTPRRFLRHPLLQNFLKDRFPRIPNPMLLDFHVSFANREHLRIYIDKVRKKFYPEGTGWKGLLYLKGEEERLNTTRYIRHMGEYPSHRQTREDEDDLQQSDSPLQIVICMLKENSFRLLNARFIQSDIGFKRVVGWKEFELGGQDPLTRITITYCRVYTNRQTAEAHRIIFHRIDDIVHEDTGENLRWRHIHSNTVESERADGIYQLTVDLHGGQAAGFGKYLCDIAHTLPPKRDLHEVHRFIQDLDEYDHLRRIIRACVIHFFRNIETCAVPDNVKQKMRSLVCIEHDSWNVTLREIEEEGGKAAQDWVADKHRSKFAFPAICWERSYIPLPIWKSGPNNSNIIEQLHQDVNREGITCTLVGGVSNGRHFDTLKSKTLETTVSAGIHPSYQKGHISGSVVRSLQRKSNLQAKIFKKQDDILETRNENLQQAFTKKVVADEDYILTLDGLHSDTKIQQAAKRKETASKLYEKALKASLSGIGTGSGRVGILLPANSEILHTE